MTREYINGIPILLYFHVGTIPVLGRSLSNKSFVTPIRNELYQLDQQLSCYISDYGLRQQVNAYRIKSIAL